MNPSRSACGAAWYRHGIVWLVIGGPAAVVVAGIATLLIALAHPDPVLPTTATPAVQARNHAISLPQPAALASPEGSAGRLERPGAVRPAPRQP